MTEKEKDLLFKDLTSRLGEYSLMVRWNGEDYNVIGIGFGRAILIKPFMSATSGSPLIEEVKPYLRPMSSMTDREKNKLIESICGKEGTKHFHVTENGIDSNDEKVQNGYDYEWHWINFNNDTISVYVDFCISHNFDWRGLIERGLAIEAPEGMYEF